MPGRLLVLALNVGGCRGVAPVGGGSLCRPGALWERRLLPLHPLPTALATAAVSPQHGALQAFQWPCHFGSDDSFPRALAGWMASDRAQLPSGRLAAQLGFEVMQGAGPVQHCRADGGDPPICRPLAARHAGASAVPPCYRGGRHLDALQVPRVQLVVQAQGARVDALAGQAPVSAGRPAASAADEGVVYVAHHLPMLRCSGWTSRVPELADSGPLNTLPCSMVGRHLGPWLLQGKAGAMSSTVAPASKSKGCVP